MPLCNQVLLCTYGNFPSLANPLLPPQLLIFVLHPKVSMIYSEGNGVRSAGELDSNQKNGFRESPFLGFPIRIIHEGVKGVNGFGFASAVLASVRTGKGLCLPFHLMDCKEVVLEPVLTRDLASAVAWTSVDTRQPSAPSSMPWRSTCMQRRGWGCQDCMMGGEKDNIAHPPLFFQLISFRLRSWPALMHFKRNRLPPPLWRMCGFKGW